MSTNINTTNTTKGRSVQVSRIATVEQLPPDYKVVVKGWTTTSNSSMQNARTDFVVKSGTTTPNFHALVTSGAILPRNPFLHSRRSVFHPFSEGWSRGYTGNTLTTQTTYSGYYGSDPYCTVDAVEGISASQLLATDNFAMIKLRDKLKDMKINIAQVIAERDQTARTLTKAARTIAEMIKQLKKGNLAGAAGAAGKHVGLPGKRASRTYRQRHLDDPSGAMASAWLELQYAWKPLLQDVYGAAEALAKARFDKTWGEVTASKTYNMSKKSKQSSASEDLYSETSGSVTVRYNIVYVIDNPSMPGLNSLGLMNPALLAWELLPYSFVADWFSPIGSWLSGLDATVGLTFLTGSRSVKTDLKTTRMAWRRTAVDGRPISMSNVTGSCEVESVSREPIFSFPAATYPPFKNPFSVTHMLSALALLRKA